MEPISKKDLEKLHDLLDRQPLACDEIWMNFSDYKEMTWVPCEACGGLRPPDCLHTPEQCNLHRVSVVMEE